MSNSLKVFGRRLRKQVTSLVLILSLVNCAGPRMIERPSVRPDTRRLAEEVYQNVWIRNEEIRTVKAVARARISRGIFSRGAEQAIVIQRPDSLRVDSLSIFGELLYQLIHYNGILHIYQPENGYYRQSDDAANLLYEELQLDVELEEVVQLLSGGIPLEVKDNYLAVQRDKELILRGLRSQVLLDAETMLPRRFAGYTRENSVYEVRFDDYREVSAIQFPFQVSLIVSRPSVSLQIDFEHVSLNEPVDSDLFHVLFSSLSGREAVALR